MATSTLSAPRFCGQLAASVRTSASTTTGQNLTDRGMPAGRALLCSRLWGRNVTLPCQQRIHSATRESRSSTISMGWAQVPGVLKTISSGDERTVVGTADDDRVYRFDGSGFELASGSMAQVSVGLSGMWAVDKKNQLYEWDEPANEFVEVTPMPGSGAVTQVAAGQDVYVLDTRRKIFKYQGEGSWVQLDGELDAIETSDYGDLWGMQIGELRRVFRRYGGRWIYVVGPEGRDNLKQISTGVSGVWAVTTANAIFRWVPNTGEPGAWVKEEGSLKSISSGYPTVWGLDKQGKVYKYVIS